MNARQRSAVAKLGLPMSESFAPTLAAAQARIPFDHQQAGVAGEGRGDAPLRRVEVRDAAEPGRVSHRSCGARTDAVDQVGFDGEDAFGCQAADVLRDVIAFQ